MRATVRPGWGRELAVPYSLAFSLLFVALIPAAARASEVHSRFGYCAPPFPPPCAQEVDRIGGASPACEKELERYIASVFGYRACLAAETERAVREANATIQKLRCARDPNKCPIAEPSPAPAPKSARHSKSKAKP